MAATVSPWALAADLFDPPENPYLHDPDGWVSAKTRERLWSEQVHIMRSVQANRRTAVPACHGPGKSFTAARLVAWWLDVHPPGTAFAVTTAPTDRQVKAILWREIIRAHKRGRLPGYVTQTAEWKIGDELVAYGRKPADHDEDGFQGIHALHVLVILDEACGIPKQLWTAAATLLTNENARILAVGNPDHPSSEFARVCDGADPVSGGVSALGWNVIPIGAHATPNFTGEKVPDSMRAMLTSELWVEEFARDVGGTALVEANRALLDRFHQHRTLPAALEAVPDDVREVLYGSPLYVAKVLGQFPDDASDGVIPWSAIKHCVGDQAVERGGPLRVPVELGIDIGGSDLGDETVVYERQGRHVGRRWSIRSADPEKVLGLCETAIRTALPGRVKIDSIGIGWGIMAGLRRSFPDLDVCGVNVAEAASDPGRFVNQRAEIWWQVGRRLSLDGGWDLTGIGEESTLAELAAPRWSEDKSGRIVVESKDDIRKRLGRSTDNADAVLLAFADPPSDQPEAKVERYRDLRLRGRR